MARTQSELYDAIGGQPGLSIVISSTAQRIALREWLATKGVDPIKASRCNDSTLAAAFRNPRYLQKMIDDKSSGARWGGPRDVDIDSMDTPAEEAIKRVIEGYEGKRDVQSDVQSTEAPRQTYGEAASQRSYTTPASEPASASMPATAPRVAHVGDEALTITKAQLHKATEEIVGRRLSEAEKALSRQITDGLAEAIRAGRIPLSVEARTEANRIATESARFEARRYLAAEAPHKIEIKAFGKTKTLPTEPRHQIFDRAFRLLSIGEHVYLVGPAGTGKTHLFKQLAAAMDKRFLPMGQALTKYEFSGFLDGSGTYRGTILRDAVQNGGLLCLDEIDMFGAAAVGFMNSALANDFISFPDAVVKVHPDFQCLAAANTYGRGATQEYIGRNPLDAASVDRFAFLTCDYDETLERQLYGDDPWTEYVQRIRKAVRELKIQHVVSMRATLRVKRALHVGLGIDEALDTAIWRGMSADSISKITRHAGTPPQVISEPATSTDDDIDLDAMEAAQ